MGRKKSEQPELSEEQQALVQHVDEMLSVEPLPEKPAEELPKTKRILKIIPTHHSSDDEVKVTPGVPKKEEAEPILKLSDTLPETEAPTEGELPPMPPLPTDSAEASEPETMTEAEPITPAKPESPAVNSSEAMAEEIEDKATDKAVDDIVAKESDAILALEDVKTRRGQPPAQIGGWKDKLRAVFTSKKFWIVVIVLLVIVFGIPLTRYKVLGLALKKPVYLQIIDSKTGTPVSNAEVSLGGTTVKTDADGKVQGSVGVGKQSVTISKAYYTTAHTAYFVGFKASPATTVKLVATGRLVPITVKNSITGKPLAGVQIKVLHTIAKTDTKGQASVGVPVGKATLDATLTRDGYNKTLSAIQVTDKVVKQNTITLTPAGQVYFLSNARGVIDVIKSNLDGSNRKTVLQGTGKEEQGTTTLLASRDWRYLVLKARRDTPQAALYLIDTQTDKVTNFDTSGSDFRLVGWYDHNFIYELERQGQSAWQAGTQQLKSYDADNQQLNQLDQSQAEGGATGYAYQAFDNFYIVNDAVVYTTQWSSYAPKGDSYDISAKSDTIRGIQPDGKNKKDYQSFPATTTASFTAQLYEPQAIYLSVHDSSAGSKTAYYKYEDQAVKTVDEIPAQDYPTYLLSPSGSKTFWTQLIDGKSTLFVGDAKAANKKQIFYASEQAPYGWYSESYILTTKNGSELYIMPAGGQTSEQRPLKITDYYKPAQTFPGYGYGYGGL